MVTGNRKLPVLENYSTTTKVLATALRGTTGRTLRDDNNN